MRLSLIGKSLALGTALAVSGYLLLCWHLHTAMGDLFIRQGDSYQLVLDQAGPPTRIDDVKGGARWTNFRGTDWELLVLSDKDAYDSADHVSYVGITRRSGDILIVQCHLPASNGLQRFFSAPTYCQIR